MVRIFGKSFETKGRNTTVKECVKIPIYMKKQIIFYIFILFLISCSNTNQVSTQQIAKSTPKIVENSSNVNNLQNHFEENVTPLSKIDLSKIGHISPKCRVQDKGNSQIKLNDLKVVDDLIANGKESIPFLISKLDDNTKINDPVIDFWGEIHIGDVAFIILTDFFTTDCDSPKGTISGVSWNEFLGCTNPDIPAQNCYIEYIEKNGRKTIKKRWQNIWEENKDKIYWDETDRCFKVKSV